MTKFPLQLLLTTSLIALRSVSKLFKCFSKEADLCFKIKQICHCNIFWLKTWPLSCQSQIHETRPHLFNSLPKQWLELFKWNECSSSSNTVPHPLPLHRCRLCVVIIVSLDKALFCFMPTRADFEKWTNSLDTFLLLCPEQASCFVPLMDKVFLSHKTW